MNKAIQERLTLKQLSERIFRSRQQVYNMVEQGLPREADGSFVWADVWRWWNSRADAKAAAIQADPEGYPAAELRRMKADARLKELKAAQMKARSFRSHSSKIV
jgi:hypothetical protein